MTGSTSFAQFDLNPLLLRAVLEQHCEATSIQEQTIPPALAGKDILGSAPTGTGKTWAFLIPTIQHLLDFPRRKPGPPRVLILAPTRELVMQIAKEAIYLTKYTLLKTTTITGGVAYINHADVFSKNQDIIIATTGRLLQYIREENFDCHAIEMLILDEADRMLDMGFTEDVKIIANKTHHRKQTLLFSATLEGQGVYDFSKRILNDPREISTEPSRRERKKIQQYYYFSDNLSHKINLLLKLLANDNYQKTIVFVRKRERVHELVAILKEHGINCSFLEGEMVQAKRSAAIEQLQNNQATILIATDVAARGLDIDDLSHVINFDMPRAGDIYLHRIGRTARGGKKGSAISLVEAHDYALLTKIENYLQTRIKPRTFSDLKPFTKVPMTVKKKSTIKKEKPKNKTKEKDKKRIKRRLRDAKNIGKRRQPSSAISSSHSYSE